MVEPFKVPDDNDNVEDWLGDWVDRQTKNNHTLWYDDTTNNVNRTYMCRFLENRLLEL